MERFNNKLERRDFLNKSGKILGAVSAGALFSTVEAQDPVFARLNKLQVEKHSKDFIIDVKKSIGNRK